ncbi:bifunctional lysylphosphatidylglycerol flippase/synthetase MprF [Pseudonocardia asaccharolytica]|uniref:Phosphatidylglycerol lysyltransferase C-terminal domain-containing protein n=1 Tax=Pseudonocardia asaccharolytica DSM 44247 = NBRC 16224 TaxID=1123024 RepID=A0A511CZS9_9PSEU|nr:DUF2156 domain-containing protein [Pseudonocardia asaccharolytica]GEL18049.1 hypothetical protein PA7_18860 [Pseudonocardia asaccharolytica DSM 44247 = NBRC 16224]
MAEQTRRAPTTTRSAGPARAGRERLAVLLRRLPFTTVVVALMLAAGIGTGSLWHPVTDRPWYPLAGYGIPALADGYLWTPVTAAFFALTPLYYLPMAGGFAVLVGFAECRLGTRRAALVTIGGQLVGLVGATLLLLALRGTGWAWAVLLAGQLDVGFSAGALAAVAATSAVLRSPWRLRLRLALGIYLLVSILYVGSLADLEHLIAGVAGLLAGGTLTRNLGPPPGGRASRREWRLLAVAGVAVIAVGTVVVWLVPSEGPLGATAGADGSLLDVLITLILAALLVNGLRRGRRAAWWWGVVIAGLNVLLGVAVGVLAAVAVALDLPYQIEGAALFVVDRLFWAALLVVLVAGRHAFQTPGRRRRRRGVPGATDRDTATALLIEHGGGTLSWMATWPDNAWFRTADGDSIVAYQAHAGVAIGLGDPIGPSGSQPGAVAEFARMTERSGLVPCLFSVTTPVATAASGLGWQHVQVAEDTLIDLPDLEFVGKPWQNVRSALNRAAKEGVEFRLAALADEPWSLVERVRGLAEEWVGDKGLPEMGFTLGGVDEALDPRVRVALAQDAAGTLHGVTSWLPIYGPGGHPRGWTLDLMLRRHDGFRAVVEFLIARSCQAFRADGAAVVSLSGAPLARSGDAGEAAGVQRVLDGLGTALEPLYGFGSLHAFKAKFRPRYEPLHLTYRDEGDLARIGIALTRAYLPDTPVRELLRLTRA